MGRRHKSEIGNGVKSPTSFSTFLYINPLRQLQAQSSCRRIHLGRGIRYARHEQHASIVNPASMIKVISIKSVKQSRVVLHLVVSLFVYRPRCVCTKENPSSDDAALATVFPGLLLPSELSHAILVVSCTNPTMALVSDKYSCTSGRFKHHIHALIEQCRGFVISLGSYRLRDFGSLS